MSSIQQVDDDVYDKIIGIYKNFDVCPLVGHTVIATARLSLLLLVGRPPIRFYEI